MSELGPVVRSEPATSPSPQRLKKFNLLPRDDAWVLVSPCFEVPRWTAAIVDARAYTTIEDLLKMARDAASPLTAPELDTAFTHRLASCLSRRTPLGDESGVNGVASGSTTIGAALDEQIFTWAARYESRFARPFLIRRRGRSREEIVAQLQIRIENTDEAEDRAISHELRQIATLALTRRVSP